MAISKEQKKAGRVAMAQREANSQKKPSNGWQNYVKKEQELRREVLKEAEQQTKAEKAEVQAQENIAKAEQQEAKAEEKVAKAEKEGTKTEKQPKPTKSQGKITSSTLWLMLIFAFILYLSDWAFGFNGIDIDYFKDLSILNWIIKGGFLSIAVIVFAFEWFFNENSSPQDKVWAAAFAFVFAAIFIMSSGSIAASYHLIFLGFLFFTVINPTSETSADAYRTAIFLVLFDFIGFSLLELLLSYGGQINTLSFVSNRLIVPIYVLYLLGKIKNNTVGFERTIANTILFLISGAYIAYILTLSGPAMYADFISNDLNSQIDETTEFRQTAFGNLKNSFSIITDPFFCFRSVGDGTYDECIQNRDYERQCSNFKNSPAEFQNCIASKKTGSVAGQVDESIKEYTKVEFDLPNNFPDQIQKEFAPAIPMDIHIESPKKQLDISFSCNFEKGKEDIEGIIQSEDKFSGLMGTYDKTVLCSPSTEYISDNYDIIFNAKIEGIETTSRLTRLFVNNNLEEKRRNELLRTQQLSQKETTEGPDEFAMFSIGIGSPATDPFIDSENVALIGSIENRANGQILGISKIEIELPEGITPTDSCYGSDGNAFTYDGKKLIARSEVLNSLSDLEKLKKDDPRLLISCSLEVSSDLIPSEEELQEYNRREFRTNIEYAYQIEKKADFEVISA